MPRSVALLFLIVAFAGPLLTHAEAAGDLARSLIETQGAGDLEIPDGGVGDDPNVASVWRSCPTIDTNKDASSVWDRSLFAITSDVPRSQIPNGHGQGQCRASWPSSGRYSRHGWLQYFLC